VTLPDGPDATRPAAAAGTLVVAGVEVARLGFGAMHLTGPGVWGPPLDRQRAVAVLRRAIDLGVGLVDTADAYGPDTNEEVVAEALYPYPADVLVATKGGMVRSGPGHWGSDGSPAHLRAACEGSLRRLRVDVIDLYQFHRPDPRVPFADSVGVLAELRAEGKVRHVGLSNVSVAQLRVAQAVVPVASVQNQYSLHHRDGDDVVAACEAAGIAFLPYRPLDVGRFHPAHRVARALGVDVRQVALAALLARSPVVVPIPGTGSIAHLEANVASAALALDAGQVRKLIG
jgi:pyridoxine 4-dehydrogenase